VPVRAVWFDVGEVLINETREYGAWADWLGVPRHTFSAVFGAVIARGQDYRDVFQVFRPGFDLDTERRKRIDAGCGEALDESDLYPDARPCLQALKDAGYFVGIAGNQTARAGGPARRLGGPPSRPGACGRLRPGPCRWPARRSAGYGPLPAGGVVGSPVATR
jgi:phosphoglycolate phosphatase-like HAD superfamily hydrolase